MSMAIRLGPGIALSSETPMSKSGVSEAGSNKNQLRCRCLLSRFYLILFPLSFLQADLTAGDNTAPKHATDLLLKPTGTKGKIPVDCFADFGNCTGLQIMPEQFPICRCSFSTISNRVTINRMGGDERRG
jgi:hypothetical protein